jgi:hypothetical protein
MSKAPKSKYRTTNGRHKRSPRLVCDAFRSTARDDRARHAASVFHRRPQCVRSTGKSATRRAGLVPGARSRPADRTLSPAVRRRVARTSLRSDDILSLIVAGAQSMNQSIPLFLSVAMVNAVRATSSSAQTSAIVTAAPTSKTRSNWAGTASTTACPEELLSCLLMRNAEAEVGSQVIGVLSRVHVKKGADYRSAAG